MPTEATGLEHLTPVRVHATTATERASFRRCHRQWFLSVVHHLESFGGSTNLWLGTIVHSGLQAYYEYLRDHGMDDTTEAKQHALDAYETVYGESIVELKRRLGIAWDNASQQYYDLGELGFGMLDGYFDREVSDPIVDEIVDVERRVFVPIRRTPETRKLGTLSVRTDLVGRRAGVLVTVDHKTASRDFSDAQLDLDDQLTAEVYATWVDSGEFPDEAYYNALFKKVPGPPKRLKDGKGGVPRLSTDKTQSTTYALYLAELKSLGLSPADYAEFLDYLNDQESSEESPFYRRVGVIRTPQQMASFEVNLFYEFMDMRRVAAHPETAYPNPTPLNCASCPVKLVCLTMSDDGDVESIIKADYVVADPRA